ncbi:MAG: hypothetical protein ABSC06_35880 [Rhodopila sp.]|jgi:hypothetical protein
MSDEAQRAAEDVFWRRLNIRADTLLKAEQLRWEPWKVVIASAASGGALVVATATAMGFVLHLMGKI